MAPREELFSISPQLHFGTRDEELVPRDSPDISCQDVKRKPRFRHGPTNNGCIQDGPIQSGTPRATASTGVPSTSTPIPPLSRIFFSLSEALFTSLGIVSHVLRGVVTIALSDSGIMRHPPAPVSSHLPNRVMLILNLQ